MRRGHVYSGIHAFYRFVTKIKAAKSFMPRRISFTSNFLPSKTKVVTLGNFSERKHKAWNTVKMALYFS